MKRRPVKTRKVKRAEIVFTAKLLRERCINQGLEYRCPNRASFEVTFKAKDLPPAVSVITYRCAEKRCKRVAEKYARAKPARAYVQSQTIQMKTANKPV